VEGPRGVHLKETKLEQVILEEGAGRVCHAIDCRKSRGQPQNISERSRSQVWKQHCCWVDL